MTAEELRRRLALAAGDFEAGRIDAVTFSAQLLQIQLLHAVDLEERSERKFTKNIEAEIY